MSTEQIIGTIVACVLSAGIGWIANGARTEWRYKKMVDVYRDEILKLGNKVYKYEQDEAKYWYSQVPPNLDDIESDNMQYPNAETYDAVLNEIYKADTVEYDPTWKRPPQIYTDQDKVDQVYGRSISESQAAHYVDHQGGLS